MKVKRHVVANKIPFLDSQKNSGEYLESTQLISPNFLESREMNNFIPLILIETLVPKRMQPFTIVKSF